MSIIFKPVNGTLDVNTEPADLPEQGANGTLVSSAMSRCKNLRLDRPGALVLRDGSSKVSETAVVDSSGAIVELIVEQAGIRYEFLSNGLIYKDETLITDDIQVETPTFSPEEGVYSAAQTVTISCDTLDVTIWYTLDGTTPSSTNGFEYAGPITLPEVCRLKAIAVKSGYEDSEIASGFYSVTDMKFITEGGSYLITETDSSNIISEGQ